MVLRRDPTKALQIGFLALLILSLAQVAWWISESVTFTRSTQDQLLSLYNADADAVSAFYSDNPDALEVLLPHLDISPEIGTAIVNDAVLAVLEDQTSSRINRLVWEGIAQDRVTGAMTENPDETVNSLIATIFAEFPR